VAGITMNEGSAHAVWRPGDTVVIRYLTRDGKPGMSWPASVVEDRPDVLALFIPEGVTYKLWGQVTPPEGGAPVRGLVDGAWRRDTLRLMFPGRYHSVWLSWDRTPGGRAFHGYYINMEEPYRRSLVGVDTNDHALDVVVAPDLSWTWKDADELDRRAETGTYYPEFVARVHEEGRRAVADLEARVYPYTGEWVDWTPDMTWGQPSLPADWDQAPPVVWPERLAAYRDMNPIR
jgi:hypothetical protein